MGLFPRGTMKTPIFILLTSLFILAPFSSLIAQDSLDYADNRRKRLKTLRRSAKEYFWDLEKLEALLNLEKAYTDSFKVIKNEKQVLTQQNSLLQKQIQLNQNRLEKLDSIKNEIAALETSIVKSEKQDASKTQKIKKLNFQLDSLRTLYFRQSKQVTQLSQEILQVKNDSSSQKEIRRLKEALAWQIEQAAQFKPVNQAIKPDNDADFLRMELIRTKFVYKEQIKVLQAYARSLEEKLEQNGINYAKLKEQFLLEMGRIRNRVNELNLTLLRKDSLRARDSLMALQKLQLVQAEKKAAEAAKELAEAQHLRNVIISSLVAFLLSIIAIISYRHYRKSESQKQEISVINAELAQQNEEILTQKEYIEDVNSKLKISITQITDSIRYAQTIQTAILPPETTFQQAFSDHFILFRPKNIVSGDFYWCNQVDNKTVVAAVDCTGHGVPGAFMSMIGNTVLNKLVNEEKLSDSVEILNRLNSEIQISLKQEDGYNQDGMDVALCVIQALDEQTYQIDFTGAKRSLLYKNPGENTPVNEMRGDNKSIGGQQNNKKSYSRKELVLEKGTILYLTSDGFADQNNEQRKKYGRLALRKLLQKYAHVSLLEQKQALEDALVEHQGKAEQRDDITILGLKL